MKRIDDRNKHDEFEEENGLFPLALRAQLSLTYFHSGILVSLIFISYRKNIVTESQKDSIHFLVPANADVFPVVAFLHLRERRPDIRLRSQPNFLVITCHLS